MINEPDQRQDEGGVLALLRALRRRIGVVLVCLLVVPAAALGWSLAQEKQYSASASLLFRDPGLDQKLFNSTVFSPATDPDRVAATNVKLVSLQTVAARTSRALNGRLTPAEIKSKVAVASEGQSDVASITATDPDPDFAVTLADTFAEQFIAFRREADRSKIAGAQKLVAEQLARLPEAERDSRQAEALRQRGEELRILAALQTGNAELVQPAERPSSPSSPQPLRNTFAGAVLGLLLGLGLAILLERLDRRLKDPSEIAAAFDRPVLGAIPESRAIAAADAESETLSPGEAEAFRMLRANLRYFNVDHSIRSVLITSSAPADGKSTVARHLAATAAATGMRVLLVEADLRRPTLAQRLQLPNSRGLSQLLAGELDSVHDAKHTVPIAGGRASDISHRTMDVVLSGPIPPNPTDLIESERMRSIIRGAEHDYELVVIDTPPTSVVSDAIPLVKEVSGVIVVCRLGKTTRESAAHLRSQLVNLEANTLGVVVNSVGRTSGRYGYGYGYAAGYTTPEPKPSRGRARKSDRGAGAEPAQAVTARRTNGAPTNGAPSAPEREREREPVATGAATVTRARPSAGEDRGAPAVQPMRSDVDAAAEPTPPAARQGGLLRRRRRPKP